MEPTRNNSTPFEMCMQTPRPTIPRSPAVTFIIEETEDGAEWCTSISDAKGYEMREPDKTIEEQEKEENERLRQVAEMNEAWINEYRTKMFRHIYGVKLKTEVKK